MKKVSIMEAQHNLSKVLKQVEEGTSIYITRRGKVVARLEAPPEETPATFPDFAERAKQTWGRSKQKGSFSDELLDITRGDR
jgi:antitoxin (DNA-binding transcriptional repressor) of toxin-antitoxin stability system